MACYSNEVAAYGDGPSPVMDNEVTPSISLQSDPKYLITTAASAQAIRVDYQATVHNEVFVDKSHRTTTSPELVVTISMGIPPSTRG